MDKPEPPAIGEGRGKPKIASLPYHSVGVATDAFTLPFSGALLTFRAGQRVVAHPALRAAIEQHRLPVRFEDA